MRSSEISSSSPLLRSKKSSESSSSSSFSPVLRSKKPQTRSSKTQSTDHIQQLSTKTPEKPPQLLRRSRNRGVALSIGEVRKVAEGLQERHHDPASQVKSARRQIAMPSPETKPRKSNTTADEPTKLPEKYEILGEVFDSLDSSIRLLRLKGSKPYFTKIRPMIESLTDRRFTHGHLAQLKFIFPEAIVIEKSLVRDERTCCMETDLQVTINPKAVESDTKLLSERASVSLRKLFRTRLKEFRKSHPEVDEIPEEKLPETSFATETSSDACATHPPAILSSCIQDNDITDKPDNREENLSVPVKKSIEALKRQPAVASHMSKSFRRRFSQKSMENGADNVQKKSLSDSFQPLAFPVSESTQKKNSHFVETRSHSKTCPAKLASEAANGERCPTICATPSKAIDYTDKEDGSLRSIDALSTPAKLDYTPSRLMTVTPALPTPKRHYMSPDDNSSGSPNKLVRRPPRSRSLKFDTPVKNEQTENKVDDAGGISIDDVIDVLPENLLQSIREKERMAKEERDPAISHAKRRQKVIASLPKLFNKINHLFHSINRSVITKEELVNKIISSHFDIVDRREVEEQLNLLLELVPEWISEKLASSGDFLFCINKMLNPETIRTRLEEAK